MDEDEFTLPALLVTDHIIQGLQSGSVSCMLPGMHTHTPPGRRAAGTSHTHDACSAHVSVQILASEAGATLPGVNEENQLSFLTQLCDAYIEVRVCAHQQLPIPQLPGTLSLHGLQATSADLCHRLECLQQGGAAELLPGKMFLLCLRATLNTVTTLKTQPQNTPHAPSQYAWRAVCCPAEKAGRGPGAGRHCSSRAHTAGRWR